jgi:hypothetical protein
MSGGELGKHFLDPLQNDVNQSTWSSSSATNRLSNPVNATPQDVDIDGKTYTGTYTINTDSPSTNLNKAKVTIDLSK